MSHLVKREAETQRLLEIEPVNKQQKVEALRIVAPGALFSYIKKERQTAGVLFTDVRMLQDFGDFKRGEEFEAVSMHITLHAWRGEEDFETDALL